MKIVFIGGRDIHVLGGIENYTFNLATQLVRMGNEVIVFCESNHNGTEIVKGFEVRYIKSPSSNLICKPFVGLLATLIIVFKERNTDLIHYNAWPPSVWSWIASLAGITSLMEGHGLEWKRSKYGPWARKILKTMEAVTARLNKNLVMCSQDQVKYFKETYNKDAVCIPGAINLPDAKEENTSDILDKYSIPSGKYFLFMGRLVQDKNPDFLIKAFSSLCLKGFKLVIAGGNDALPDYINYLHTLSDNPDIVFTGPVYEFDKSCLLKNAFAFCLPSTIEGLSIVLMEAMSYKLPIIASNIEANRELLFDNAYYVRPENEADLREALCFVANDGISKKAIEANYNYLAENFTWNKVALKYAAYIQKICK